MNYVDNYPNMNTIAKFQVFFQSMVMILLINSLLMNKLSNQTILKSVPMINCFPKINGLKNPSITCSYSFDSGQPQPVSYQKCLMHMCLMVAEVGIIRRIHCIWCLSWGDGIGESELELLLSMEFSKWLTWTSWQSGSIGLTGFLTRQLPHKHSRRYGIKLQILLWHLLKSHAVSFLPLPFGSKISILHFIALHCFLETYFFFFFPQIEALWQAYIKEVY